MYFSRLSAVVIIGGVLLLSLRDGNWGVYFDGLSAVVIGGGVL